jgi:predicted permease
MQVVREVKHALRSLLKRRAFSVITVLVLALGIGANTAIFSVVNSVLLRPLPFNDASRLVQIWHVPPAKSFPGIDKFTVSPANFLDWQAQNDTLDMAIYHFESFTLTGAGHSEPVYGYSVSSRFFPVLGVQPLMGRTFSADDDTEGSTRTVVISEGFWRSNLGGNPNVLGQTIRFSDQPYTVIGVMPGTFAFPAGTPATQVWTGLHWDAKERAVRGNHNYFAIGRLKPGATLEKANAELSAASMRMEKEYPADDAGWGTKIIPLREELVGDVRPALLVLLGAVGFVLLIACANVANLVLATTLARRKELAIRTALGAGRWSLIRQVLLETTLLAIAGGALGLFFAHFGVQLIVNFLSDQLPRVREISLDSEVLLFTALLSVITGLLAGLLPAWRFTRGDVNEALKQGLGRTDSDASGGRIRNVLVTVEVALSLMLLVGAGLMIRTLFRLQKMDTGIDTQNVLTASVPIPKSKYTTDAEQRTFYDQVLAKVRTIPGVEAASMIDTLPFQGGSTQPIGIEGRPALQMSDQPEVAVRKITPGYLQTMKIPLLRGRDIQDSDTVDHEQVILISDALAKKFFPDEDPMGRHLTLALEDTGRDLKPTPRTIVGIVGNVKVDGIDNDMPMTAVYDPFHQMPSWFMTLSVRTAGNPNGITNSVRNAVQSVDSDISLRDIATMEEVAATSIAQRRFTMMLLVTFAGLAVVLAAVGIYSVLSYAVRRRVREIGIRMALGAQIRDVVRLIVIDGIIPTLLGVAIGAAGALALGRVLASIVYGVSSRDAATFFSVSALLVVVALAATAFPAYRATQVEPVRILREE